MTPERFEELFEASLAKVRHLAVVKGGEYAPGADRLANFKSNADALGLPPEAVWAIYACKHMDSIRTYVRDLNENKDRVRSEPIEGRFLDLIVYCFLGLGLLEERGCIVESQAPAPVPPEVKYHYRNTPAPEVAIEIRA